LSRNLRKPDTSDSINFYKKGKKPLNPPYLRMGIKTIFPLNAIILQGVKNTNPCPGDGRALGGGL
jgi:hypothetical protein